MRWILAAFVTAALALAACSSSDSPDTSSPGQSGGSGGVAGSGGGGGAGGATQDGGQDSAQGGIGGGAGTAGAAGGAGAAGAGGSQTDGGAGTGGSQGEFAGVWALKIVMTSEMDVPVLGAMTTESVTVVRVEQTQQGDNLNLKIKTCDFDVNSSSSSAGIVVPDAYVNCLPEDNVPATITKNGSSWALNVPKYWQVRSVNLANPTTDPLPTDPSDPSVLDWDGDSHPGLTMQVTGLLSGDIYVVQRSWFILSGTTTSTDSIDGDVQWAMEQVVLDSTNALLKSLPQATPTTDQSQNYFQHRRVDASMTCADINAAVGTIFQ